MATLHNISKLGSWLQDSRYRMFSACPAIPVINVGGIDKEQTQNLDPFENMKN